MPLKSQPVRSEHYSLEPTIWPFHLELDVRGTFDMAATHDLSLLLVALEGDINRMRLRELVINVTGVYYLGSSCIKCFVTFIEAVKRQQRPPCVRFRINPQRDWQSRTFAVLCRLAPTFVSVESAAP